MWTAETRRRYERRGDRHPSDLSEAEWAIIEPMIPPAKGGGRRRTTDVREVVNAILYVLETGCQWRALPKDFPPKSTVRAYLDLWERDGTLARIHYALFSVGDTHATQGDGEVCGTAIESPMKIACRFDLIEDANLRFPRFITSGPVNRHFDVQGYEVTTGISPDLTEGARAAVSGMIELLSSRHGMTALDAYMLCGLAGRRRDPGNNHGGE
jgi:transposase